MAMDYLVRTTVFQTTKKIMFALKCLLNNNHNSQVLSVYEQYKYFHNKFWKFSKRPVTVLLMSNGQFGVQFNFEGIMHKMISLKLAMILFAERSVSIMEQMIL